MTTVAREDEAAPLLSATPTNLGNVQESKTLREPKAKRKGQKFQDTSERGYIPNVCSSQLNPHRITPKFLLSHGHRRYRWEEVETVETMPTLHSLGMSEAQMFRAVLVSRGASVPGFSHFPGTPNTRTKKYWGLGGGGSSVTRSTSFTVRAKRFFSTDDMTTTPSQHAATTKPVPPSIILKHYDTSNVDTPSLTLRWARHATATTAEKMAQHELDFYTKLYPLLLGKGCAVTQYSVGTTNGFRTPELLFASLVDHGDPGILRYVCCRLGSGTLMTLGLEDLTLSGYTFDHVQTEGLEHGTEVAWCIVRSAAKLHSTFFLHPTLASIQPSTIPRFVHRCGHNVIEKLNHNMDFSLCSIKSIVDRWGKYTPALHNLLVQNAMETVHKQWKDIRASAVQLVLDRQTVLHGDLHYQNIAFPHGMTAPYVTPSGHHVTAILEDKDGGNSTEEEWGRRTPQLQSQPQQGAKSPQNLTLHQRQESVVSQQEQATLPAIYDFQACGTGSIAADLCYFMCTSLPVPVIFPRKLANKHGRSPRQSPTPEVNNNQSIVWDKLKSMPISIPPRVAVHSSSSTNNFKDTKSGFGGAAITGGGNSAKQSPGLSPSADPGSFVDLPTSSVQSEGRGMGGSAERSTESSARRRTRSHSPNPENPSHTPRLSSQQWHIMKQLRQLREMDTQLLKEYHSALDPKVQDAYPLEKLISDVHILAKHWMGCVLLDMGATSVEDRVQLKRVPQFQELIVWGERTALRAILMCASIDPSLEEECAKVERGEVSVPAE